MSTSVDKNDGFEGQSLPCLALDDVTILTIRQTLVEAKTRHDTACALRNDIDSVEDPICVTVQDPRLGPIFFIACQLDPQDPNADYEISVLTCFTEQAVNTRFLAGLVQDNEACEDLSKASAPGKKPCRVFGH